MKEKEHSLLYHTMHSRPMPGCLPLFFLLAMVVVGASVWFVPVEMPERVRANGEGKIYIKNDRLSKFVLRRESPLPLHLPQHVDPEYQEDLAAASMPLQNQVKLLPPPPMPLFAEAADSAVLDAEKLLALPGAQATDPAGSVAEWAVAAPAAETPAVQTPLFHPAVEGDKEMETAEESE